MTDWIAFLQNITEQSDKIALRYFKAKQLKVEIKPDRTPVSQGDQDIEDFIRQQVANHHPELSIIGEEYGETKTDSNVKLIIDPIDGTKNFIAGIPFFATLLAIEEDGEVIAGLISAPATGDKWWAAKGQGAFHNGERIHVSKVSDISKSMACFGSLYGPEGSDVAEPVLNLLKQTYRQRGFADYLQHMMVAMGKAEFCMDFKIKQWDIAPLKIIIEQAGGICTDSSGNETIHGGNAICSNGQFHELIITELNGLK
jgi:histidinol-phosphatase